MAFRSVLLQSVSAHPYATSKDESAARAHEPFTRQFLEAFLGDQHVLRAIHRCLLSISPTLTPGEQQLLQKLHPQRAGEPEPVTTVWHVSVSDSFALEPENWEDVLASFEMRGALMVDSLCEVSARLDPRTHTDIRSIVREFLSRQRLVLVCGSLESAQNAYTTLSGLSGFCASVHCLHLHDSYVGCNTSELESRVGAEAATKVLTLLDKYAAALRDKLLSLKLTEFATTVSSFGYRSASVEFIVSMYDQTSSKKWVGQFQTIAKTLFNSHKLTSESFEEVAKEAATCKLRPKNREDSSTGDFSPVTLGNAVFNALFTRYLSVLMDESGLSLTAEVSAAAPVTSDMHNKDFQILVTDIHEGLGLVVPFRRSGLITLLPVATAIALNKSFEESCEPDVDDIRFQRARGLLGLISGLPESSFLKRYLSALALLLLTCDECVLLTDQTTTSFFLLHEALGLDMASGAAENPLSTTSSGVVHSVNMASFTSNTTHLPVDSSFVLKDTSLAVKKYKSRTDCSVMLIIGAHSTMLTELMVLQLLRQNQLFTCFPMLSKVWRTQQAIAANCITGDANTHGIFVLSFEVQKFGTQWTESVIRLHKGMQVLSAAMISITQLQSLQERVILGVWQRFVSLLQEILNDSQDVTLDAEVSSAIFKLLTQLKTVLSAKDWCSVMVSVLLNLYVDSSSAQGIMSVHKILSQLHLGKGEAIGIIAVAKSRTDEDKSDEEREDSESEDEKEEDGLEDFKLTDTARLVLKQTLLSISQSLASSYSANSLVSTYNLTPGSIATNSIVVSSIERNLGDWAEWVSSATEEMPGTGNYKMNWLDKLAVTFMLKPAAVPALLLSAVAELGLNLPFTSDIGDFELFDVKAAVSQCKAETKNGAMLAMYSKDNGCVSVLTGEHNQAEIVSIDASQEILSSSTPPEDELLHVFLPSSQDTALSHSALQRMVDLVRDESSPDQPVSDSPSAAAPATAATAPLVHAVVLSSSDCAREESDIHVTLKPSSEPGALLGYETVLETSQLVSCRADSFHVQVVPLAKKEAAVAQLTRLDKVYSSTYQLPVVAQLPSYSDYRLLVEHLYHSVRHCPLACGEEFSSIVLRIRWVLLLFHASLMYRLRSQTDAVSVGVDTLLFAFRVVDRIYHPGLPPEPAPGTTTAAVVIASQQATSPTNNSASRRPPVVEASGDPVDIFLSFELLVHFVGDCVYTPLLGGSSSLQGMVRATFLSFFTPASCDPNAEYFVQGKVAVPTDFDALRSKPFFKLLTQLSLVDNCSFAQLVGSTAAEVNSDCIRSLYAGIEDTLQRLGDHTCSKHLSLRSPFLCANAHHNHMASLVQSSSLLRVKGVLKTLLAGLPEKIKTDTREISDKMQQHKLGSDKKQESKRKQNKKAAARHVSREFDPLWAFVLAECLEYNKTAEALRAQVADLLNCQTSLVHHMVNRGVAVSARSDVLSGLHTMLARLMEGLVPSQWLGGRQETVKLEEWLAVFAERRHLLHNWLTLGHPSVIRLHLLRNPAGLFHALKETFALRTETPFERVHFHYALLDLNAVSSANINIINATNHGCNLMLTGVYLHNASYSYTSSTLDFLRDFSGSQFGQRLVLQVTTSHEEYEVDEEEFLCPLYAAPDCPSLHPTEHLLPCCDADSENNRPEALGEAAPLLYVPIATTEDIDDCSMNEIGLHCCAKWRLPV